MMILDKKRALMTVLAKRGEKGGEHVSGPAPMKEEDSMTKPGMEDGRHAAAQDMISAMHEKSPQKLMDAMANFHDIHASMKIKGTEEPSVEE